MEEPTSQDYQKIPISNIYLTVIMEKVPRGKIPAISICPVMRFKHVFIKLNQGGVIDPKKFALVSTRPLSDYYSEGQYKLFIKDNHLCLEFNDYVPYTRYVEYAGKNFEKYIKKIIHWIIDTIVISRIAKTTRLINLCGLCFFILQFYYI